MPDLYGVLGVGRDADDVEIKKAYKKLALQHHPDKGGDPEEFKKLQEAHATLCDSDKRRMYDMTGQIPGAAEEGGPGHGFPFGGGGGIPFDIGELFGMFGRGRGHAPQSQGPRVRRGKAPAKVSPVSLSLKDFYYGRKFEVSFDRKRYCGGCKGRGSKEHIQCDGCHGTGQVNTIIQMGPGMIMQQSMPCNKCGGSGSMKGAPCGECSGSCFNDDSKHIEFNVKPGTKIGTRFTFAGESSNEEPYEEAGDVILEVVEAEEESFWTRDGEKMRGTLSITMADSLVGKKITIGDHPGWPSGLRVYIPAGVQNGSTVRVAGAGMICEDGISKGDAFILINVRTNTEERDALKKHAIMLQSIFNKTEEECTIGDCLCGIEEGL